jgi:hypothetical protein
VKPAFRASVDASGAPDVTSPPAPLPRYARPTAAFKVCSSDMQTPALLQSLMPQCTCICFLF